MAKKVNEKSRAYELFMHSDFTQKAIAETVGVSERTLSQWAKDENWDNLRLARDSSNTQTLMDLREILSDVVKANKAKKEEKSFNKNDADTVLELVKAIDILEGAVPLRTYIQVLEEFTQTIPKADAKFLEKFADYQTIFLKHKASKK